MSSDHPDEGGQGSQAEDLRRRFDGLHTLSKALHAKEYSLPALLTLVVESAVGLTKARYGAIGLFDEAGERLIDLFTAGLDEERKRAIGPLPVGRGLLGKLDEADDVVRIRDLTRHPAFTGFPPHHPSMRSFLGVSIRADGRLFGRIYLTEKRDAEEFTEVDEQTVALLAVQAGLAIDVGRFLHRARAFDSRYQALIEHIPDVTWTADRNGNRQFISPKVTEILGYTQEEIYREGGTLWFGRIHRDDVEQVRAAYESLFAHQRAFDVEYRIQRKDGRWIWLHDRAIGAYQRDGAWFTDGLFTDITERKRIEEALRSQTSQLNAINASLTCVVESDNWQQACATLLRAAVSQTESEYGFIGPVVDGPVLRILAHEGIQWAQTINREFYETAQRVYREQGYLEFTKFDNLFGHVITSGQAVVSNDPQTDPRSGGLPPGHPPLRCFLGVPVLKGAEAVGMIGVANRAGGYTGTEQEQLVILTRAAGALFDSYRRQQERERLERQLRQAEKMAAMGTLIAGVSHEINNPLFALSGYIDLANERVRCGEPEGLAKDLAAMGEAVARATAMVQRFLRVAHSPARHRGPCAVNEVVEGGLELAAHDCQLHGVGISRDLAPDLPLIEADSQELLQVMLNLFTNARQAMTGQGRGTLTVATSLAASPYHPVPSSASSGAWIEIRVQDDGPGIAPEHLGRVFEPFFTTKPVGEGTGLGLSMSHRIVTEHGGTITCRNNPGRGATFMIRLPVGTSE